MIKSQVFGVSVFAAILASVAVTYINAGAFHCRLAAVSADVDVMTQPDNGWNAEHGRGRMKDIVAVIFLDKNGAAKPQTNRPGNPHGPKRFVRKV